MTSILTNAGAVSALQTLRSINSQMLGTQQQVSTGLRVGTASDNAAYWSIATTMQSDEGVLSAVQDALGLGASKVDTAYSAMESAIDVVREIKNKLVAASEPGVDVAKVQEEISQLQDQLRSVTSSASFSGENWLQANIGGRYDSTARGYIAGQDVQKQLVSSFTRDASGNVAVLTTNVSLDETNVLFDLSGGHGGILDQGMLVGVRNSGVRDTNGADIYVRTFEFSPDWIADTSETGVYWDPVFASWPYIEFEGAYVKAWPGLVPSGPVGQETVIETSTRATLGVANYANDISVSTFDLTKMAEVKVTLGFGSSAKDRQVIAALVPFVDRQLQKMVNAAASLGSVSMRIGLQEEFVSKLSDSIDRGVGRLIDADMNEASTRLKALQTQQQLATQSLSIANSESQNILTLFR
ncbi:flagellin [Neorhizobium galegae]|uniref:flagellin N-terminal helical domain-containing protein n=1 Tax=Neorhizobium galegae TaxID=399 RepID=UPI0006212FA8|nr:flagellin [Neorhizobium galegae]MCQ1765929.1 flagellin [Neorhizobium galegae]MCQ1844843.1 flagellin [Neorhizobium galegae]CDZ40638.1 Flagellin/flagellar hook associated protein [Neorhizobium galegae bv. officinalis]